MIKILFSLILLGAVSTSCSEVSEQVNSIKDSRCTWCNSYGAKPIVYNENGVEKESQSKFCSQKCLMEYSASKQGRWPKSWG